MPEATGQPEQGRGTTGGASGEVGAPSPGEALDLIAAQRARAARALFGAPVTLLLAWGVTWFVGFGLDYFATGTGHHVPGWVAGGVAGVLGAGATAVSITRLVHQGKGVRGPSPATAARYGWAWLVGIGAVAAFDAGLAHQGLPAPIATILWPASFVAVAGLLYLAGGIVFADTVMFGLGTWTLAVAAGATFAGVPGSFAVLSLAGGGGLLVAAAVLQVRFHPVHRAG